LWLRLTVAAAAFAFPSAQAAAFLTPAEVADAISPEQRTAIEKAVPENASVAPRKPRRLLVFDHNVNYGGHPSAAHANYAFAVMGRKTGAFEAVVSRDPAVFERESLQTFDAVFFNNNVGNLFEEADLRQNLLEFVMVGGGMLGVHGTAVAFTRWPGAHEDWPEFGLMLGARGANHRINTEHVFIQLDDPGHPLNRAFGGRDFEYRDEFFRVHEPYSRHRVRVLFRIDTARTDMNQGPAYGKVERADQDYALAWIRNYGRGRTFYCTIAHNPYVFSDPLMLKFYLDAIQFALGDLDAPTTPSARLTPAVRARENLGWRIAANSSPRPDSTLFESIDRAAALGLSYLDGSIEQSVSSDLPVLFGPDLTESQCQRVRLKLDEAGLRLLSYRLPRLPTDRPAARQTLQFARVMGVETIILDTPPDALNQIASWCDELHLRLAIASGEHSDPSRLGDLLRQCRSAGPHLGIHAELAGLIRAGSDPAVIVRLLGDRLFGVELPASQQNQPRGSDLPNSIEPWLDEIHDLRVSPLLFTTDLPQPDSAARRWLETFDAISMRYAR